MWRKVLRAIGCLGYLGMLGALFGLVAYLAFSLFVRRGVTPTPELFGLPESEAVALLNDQGLRPAWSEEDERYDERVPAGHVMMQRPRAGTLVKRGSPVSIFLSRGPQLLQVPDVVGGALQAAQVTLTAAGLTVGRTLSLRSAEGAGGAVIGQRPAGGSRAERAAAVDLFFAGESSGQTWVMPDLVNRGYDQVRRFFEARGFRLGRVSYEHYTGIDPGTVLRQFPQAGHPLRRGDVIALTVAAPPPGAQGGRSQTSAPGSAPSPS
ncbi:MAG TPA: PASTA domain-containing protein [Thermoanaerobaculia bacterium]|jgi:serine/threonine-protein kinase